MSIPFLTGIEMKRTDIQLLAPASESSAQPLVLLMSIDIAKVGCNRFSSRLGSRSVPIHLHRESTDRGITMQTSHADRLPKGKKLITKLDY